MIRLHSLGYNFITGDTEERTWLVTVEYVLGKVFTRWGLGCKALDLALCGGRYPKACVLNYIG